MFGSEYQIGMASSITKNHLAKIHKGRQTESIVEFVEDLGKVMAMMYEQLKEALVQYIIPTIKSAFVVPAQCQKSPLVSGILPGETIFI